MCGSKKSVAYFAHPGCSFTVHEACARRSPRTLRSAVHPLHRLRRREAAGADGSGGGGGCEVCSEAVERACYACVACGVAVHPLCARMPGSARGPAHPDDGDGKQKQKQAAGCGSCGRALGAWRYRCVTCAAELHPRCLVPAVDQCRGAGEGEAGRAGSAASSCCLGLVHDLTRCLATLGTALHYRGYYNG